ncbi:NAD(P)/FAD-dependent oxidoreductase [Flavobacterium soli]|uniref:NAD(P)/FAD-dependent oxidoreductase n=1 Tax=Flavobacterium soli TaxID=344881 RepID=UPI00047C1687|nr:NAD(P)/FAD-dependent oxidoreductase [Flavobacterium soli]
MKNTANFDVIIIGGSYAGLSAAMALGRSLRKVLIIDAGNPCNKQTPHSHNFITQDGEQPAVIAAKAKAQVLKYDTVQFLEDKAISGERSKKGFTIKTGSGAKYSSKKLIFATGIKDIMPKIKGFAECWGISVIHCPYCHGYEFRSQKTAIMANGERAFHLASLVHNLTKKLIILTNGNANFDDTQLSKLNQNGIEIIETEITEMEHQNGQIQNVVFKNGKKISLDALYAGIPFEQHTEIPVTLGCELTEQGYIKVDPFQKTSIKGIYACGDNSSMMRSVANAVYTGNMVGAMVNKELVEEEF